MKKAIFISDFDGTVTARDFYKIMIDQHIGQPGWDYFTEYRKTHKLGYEFLNRIFGWKSLTATEYQELTGKISLDASLPDFLDFLGSRQVDFLLISAGFDRYILDTLERHGLQHLPLITNPSVFSEGKIEIVPDADTPWYSPLFGIDKGAAVRKIKQDYSLVFFAGDSEPDLGAALAADLVFATGELPELLDKEGKKYIPFTTFSEIQHYLKGLDAL